MRSATEQNLKDEIERATESLRWTAHGWQRAYRLKDAARTDDLSAGAVGIAFTRMLTSGEIESGPEDYVRLRAKEGEER